MPAIVSTTAPTTSPSSATWLSISFARSRQRAPCASRSSGRDGRTHSSPKSSLKFEMRLPWRLVQQEEADRICGKRPQGALPTLVEAMERHHHLCLEPTVHERLLAMSAATMNRLLADVREAVLDLRYARWRPVDRSGREDALSGRTRGYGATSRLGEADPFLSPQASISLSPVRPSQ